MARPIRVIVVDDSALVRDILAQGLAMDPAIEVVAKASDPYVARDQIIKHRPDVLTLDVEMPRMDGVEFLRRLMPQYPVPVVMVSALTQRGKQITLDALDAGAVDFVSKPSTDVARGLSNMMMELRTKVKIASTANVSHWKSKRAAPPVRSTVTSSALAESTDKVITIGASTGGTEPASCRMPRSGDRAAHARGLHQDVCGTAQYPVRHGGEGGGNRGPGDAGEDFACAGRLPYDHSSVRRCLSGGLQ